MTKFCENLGVLVGEIEVKRSRERLSLVYFSGTELGLIATKALGAKHWEGLWSNEAR